MPRGQLSTQCLRPVLHHRQRVGVVLRLVPDRLHHSPATRPSRPGQRPNQGHEGRLLPLPRLVLQSLPRRRADINTPDSAGVQHRLPLRPDSSGLTSVGPGSPEMTYLQRKRSRGRSRIRDQPAQLSHQGRRSGAGDGRRLQPKLRRSRRREAGRKENLPLPTARKSR